MSRSAVVQVEGLSKRYQLGARPRYRTLRDTLTEAVTGGNGHGDAEAQTIWALRDVGFEVSAGEAVGIIGPNGAGKSTLLKILSRITEPTDGWARIRGRFGSLLEVGTGFHPELTGRENIFLNGAILGMRRAEIVRQLDAIVGFAELEQFIDTPVKRYSSGMYLRLAFSVAAHLELDILAVDEVLAVGDASFQKKCLGKMEEMRAGQGRTMLFVSHNLGAIRLLTTSCVLIDHGRLIAHGDTDEVVNRYLREFVVPAGGGYVELSGPRWRQGTQKRLEQQIVYESLRLVNGRGNTTNVFFEREPIRLELAVQSKARSRSVEFIVVVLSLDGVVLFSALSGRQFDAIGEGRYGVVCELNPNILRRGQYRLRLYLRSGEWQDVIPEAATVHIEADPSQDVELQYGSTHPGLMGIVQAQSTWGELREQADAVV